MEVEIQSKAVGVEAFVELIQEPEYANKLIELIEGGIVKVSKPMGQHGEITFVKDTVGCICEAGWWRSAPWI